MSIEPVACMVNHQFLPMANNDLLDNCNLYHQSAIDELQRQLAEAQELASQINTDWIPANKKLAEQLAEREAVIADMKKIAKHVITYLDDNLSYDREADYAIEQLNELVSIPADHTALDEAIKQATHELRKQFSIQLNAFVENVNPLLADEIRSK